MAARTGMYLALLAANSKHGVIAGQQACVRLLAANSLPLADFLAASPPALLFPQKNIAIAQLKLIGTIATAEPSVRAAALAIVTEAFGHERPDVQASALDLIRKLGVPDGPERAVIADRAGRLTATLAGQAADLGLLAPAPAPRPVEANPAAGPPAAAAGLVAVTDLAELVQLFARLMEDASDPLAVERTLAGAVFLADLPAAERATAGAPLVRRAEALVADADADWLDWSGGRLVSLEIARLALAWAGCREHAQSPGAAGRPGPPEKMNRICGARFLEACDLISGGRPVGHLLAELTAADGTVSPDALLTRLASWHDGQPPRHDLEIALLRLPPVDESFWAAWASVHPATATMARRAHCEGSTPVRLEAVIGPNLQDYRPSHTLVLARVTSPPPSAGEYASRCWRLLTDLRDPLGGTYLLRDDRGLMDDSRYIAAVASWPLLCPCQPELAAAHLLRPLSDCLVPGASRAGAGAAAVMGLTRSTARLGPIGHLALLSGLASPEADVRIAAADTWAQAARARRLDQNLAAEALVTGLADGAFKVTRVADGLRRASHEPASAQLIATTIFASADRLIAVKCANMHLLLELAGEAGTVISLPEPPESIRNLAAGKSPTKLAIAARQLVRPCAPGVPI